MSFVTSSLYISNVIPGKLAIASATRNPEAGKGTGNFLKDEKVASPQLDARPSAVLRTCFRRHDAGETTDLYCEFLG